MESSAWLAFQSVNFSFHGRGLARKRQKEKEKGGREEGDGGMSFRVAKSE